MPAQHKSTTYKDAPLPNPFLEGQDRAYGDLLYDKIKEMRWWRGIVGIGVLVLFAVSLFFFVYSVSLQKTVPVLINVMPSGEANYLGEVRQGNSVTVPEAAIVWQVRKFVTNLRSISTDSMVLYNNIDECYSMVTTSYEPIMTRNLRSDSPFVLVGKLRRIVDIESVIKSTERTYQIDWMETSIESAATKKTKFRALVTIEILPANDATIKRNPLGIYIENFEMTQL